MASRILAMALVLLVVLTMSAHGRGMASSGRRRQDGGCAPDKLTVYRVVLQTAWSREVFPKQYPEWRPPAQWSKLIGRSHDSSYVLFRMSQRSSEGLKLFAEQGQTDLLDAESQGEGGIFDEFNAPPIKKGVGETDAEFFVDGNHSKVSLVSRVVPSPDWFIGVDSFDLCVEGKWVESVVLEVDPMDAGTDNGFTFTSPNWPTVPQKPITRITATSPDHPANSFYYPERPEHPPIATFHILKVKEYELARVFEPSVPSNTRYTMNDLNALAPPSHRHHNEATRTDDYDVSNDIILPQDVSSSSSSTSSSKTAKGPATGKHALLHNIVDQYKKKFRKNRRGRKMGKRRLPRNCRVSEWGEWSACSKTCGIGEQTRTRSVKKHARRGGQPCPNLQETKWCGSARDCDHRYFDW